jgi:hypothetical protein
MGLGPLATGTLSDMLRPWEGEDSLRYGLLILSPGFLWVAWHTLKASRTVAEDLESAQLKLQEEAGATNPLGGCSVAL